MEQFTSRLEPSERAEVTLTLTLDHHQRRLARLRVTLPSGESVGLNLPRGQALKEGDRLRSEPSGWVARVRAAPEHVSVAETLDPHLLTRAAYHLGNRHVALRIEAGRLIYQRDHVLDGLCRELGLTVTEQILPFEPEAGGYAGGHGHSHELRLSPLGRSGGHGH
ncbi:MAG TPA: urease accessory protein UreE [Polyangiaceae bacterium]|nr:urease accessory protein UreE [Polyangiaceae bacterium]